VAEVKYIFGVIVVLLAVLVLALAEIAK